MAIEAVKPWLAVIDRDIDAIHNNLFGPRPTVTAAAYHCQQAAEKLVKAVLVSLGQNPPKIHNIVALVNAVPADHPLRPLLLPLERFTPYAAAFRYPGATISTTRPTNPPPRRSPPGSPRSRPAAPRWSGSWVLGGRYGGIAWLWWTRI